MEDSLRKLQLVRLWQAARRWVPQGRAAITTASERTNVQPLGHSSGAKFRPPQDHDAAQHAALVAEGALTDAEARLVAAEDACRAGLAREAELEQALQAASQRSSTNAELSRAVLCSVAACALQRIVKQGSQLVAEAKAASAWPQTPTSQVHKALKARLTAEARSCDA